MKKVTITTVYKGFNYGSSLQAYASKLYLYKLGYNSEIIGYKDGLLKGRNFSFKKLFIMFLRTFWRPSLFRKTFLTYKTIIQKEISQEDRKAFFQFTENNLQVKKFSWKGLKTYVSKDDVVACICGSDQIWNATNVYIDPIYYLKFAPKQKRIAYAPSFGKKEIPPYNKEIIKKNISGFNYLSVREEQGVAIIKELRGKEVPALIDPTLLLDKNNWLDTISNLKEEKKEKYILLYFLDKPSSVAVKYIEELIRIYKCPVISIPYIHSEFDTFKCIKKLGVGPLDFVDLISNALFVCTDSFHGTAFSVNLNIPFFTFKRNYGAATDQSSRITTLLEKLQLSNRFISVTEINGEMQFEAPMCFNNSNKILHHEREKSKKYLVNALSNIESKTKNGGNNEK